MSSGVLSAEAEALFEVSQLRGRGQLVHPPA